MELHARDAIVTNKHRDCREMRVVERNEAEADTYIDYLNMHDYLR